MPETVSGPLRFGDTASLTQRERAIVVRYAAVALALVAMPLSAAERTVYRSTDDAGYPVLSDRRGGEVVPPLPINTYPANPPPGRDGSDAAPADDAPVPEPYDSLAVLFPGPGGTVRANGGEILVEARVLPALRDGHRLVVRLDGGSAGATCGPASGRGLHTGEAALLECVLSAIARGPHTLAIEVLDGQGTVVERSGPTVFHVQRVAVRR